MKTVNLHKTKWEPLVHPQFAEQVACDDDDLLALVNGEQVLAQTTAWGQRTETLNALTKFLRHDIKLQPIAKQNKRNFVQMPRVRDSRLYAKHPEYREMIDEISVVAWQYFKEQFPTQAGEHEQIVRQAIHQDWLIADTPFTSGMVNDKLALPFHKDKGYLVGTWSMMLSLRANMEGGGLQIPELGISLGVPNYSLTIFEGQRFWHGVTPLVYRKPDAYRFTLVWYAKQFVAPTTEEIE